jgi:hypothetical protein
MVHGSHPHASPKRRPQLAEGQTANSMICMLDEVDAVGLAWVAFGPPHLSVYVPLFLDSDLPAGYTDWHPTSVWVRLQGMLAAAAQDTEVARLWQQKSARLQARIDQETDEFLDELRALRRSGEQAVVQRQTALFMQNHVELLENMLRRPQAVPAQGLAYADYR